MREHREAQNGAEGRLCEVCGTAKTSGKRARMCAECRRKRQSECARARGLCAEGHAAYRERLHERAARGHETAGLGVLIDSERVYVIRIADRGAGQRAHEAQAAAAREIMRKREAQKGGGKE